MGSSQDTVLEILEKIKEASIPQIHKLVNEKTPKEMTLPAVGEALRRLYAKGDIERKVTRNNKVLWRVKSD